MQARVKAGWVTEAELARRRPPKPSRRQKRRSRRPKGVRTTMLAVAQDNELDRGATSVAPRPSVTCALTRELKPAADMIRFVVGPDGDIGPRRQTQTCPAAASGSPRPAPRIEEAVKRNVFARGFKRDVRVAADLAAADGAADGARGARCAGDRRQGRPVVTGFAKVEAAIGGDNIAGADPRSRRRRTASASWTPPCSRNTMEKSREIAVDRRVFRRPIGFGIEPSKCGTCSPACRTRERDFSGARHAFERFRTGNSPDCS